MAGVMVVFGTRPEAIKLIPVIEALGTRGIATRICVSGQHGALLQGVLRPAGIEPHIDLDLMMPERSLAELTGLMISALGAEIARTQPERLIVQGDTATAVAATHAAFLSGVAVAHVEAGLRTGDLSSPFPEEGNRRMIAALADLHFAPTPAAAAALVREGVPEASVHMTGNTIVDALRGVQSRLAADRNRGGEVEALLEQAGGKRLILVTCHRRENHGAIGRIAHAIRMLAARPDVLIVLPVHPNPAVRPVFLETLADERNIALVEPMTFPGFVSLMSAAHFIITDSGGVQEEAPVLGVPVLVMRNTTERPEGVTAGTALLVGTEPRRIAAEATRLLDSPIAHARMARRHSPYGDGRAAERIADIICAASVTQRRRYGSG